MVAIKCISSQPPPPSPLHAIVSLLPQHYRQQYTASLFEGVNPVIVNLLMQQWRSWNKNTMWEWKWVEVSIFYDLYIYFYYLFSYEGPSSLLELAVSRCKKWASRRKKTNSSLLMYWERRRTTQAEWDNGQRPIDDCLRTTASQDLLLPPNGAPWNRQCIGIAVERQSWS